MTRQYGLLETYITFEKFFSTHHISHVLCTCAFLIWILNNSNNYRANFLILNYLKELNVPYFVWKNQSKRTKAAKVMAIQSFDDARATIVLTLNVLIWGDFVRGASESKNPKILKYIKWICSEKEKLRGTRCKYFSNRFNASVQSYTKKTVKMFPC